MHKCHPYDVQAMQVFVDALVDVLGVREYLSHADPHAFEYWVAFGDEYDICLKALRSGFIVTTVYHVTNGLYDYPGEVVASWVVPSSETSDAG